MPSIPFPDLRVLLVDDKPFIRSLVNSMLLQAGVRHITQAGNGEEAITELRKAGGRFDCVISDFNMHPMNGLQLLQSIRADQILSTSAEICFILLTGSGDAETVNLAIALDVHGYLVKPVSHDALIKGLDNALQRRMTFKGPRTYLSISSLELARAHGAEPNRTPPWIMWVSSAERRAQWEERLRSATQDDRAQTPRDNDPIVFRRTQRLPVTDILTGSVLAENIHADGRLLLSSGTVLKESILSRLRELAAESREEMSLLIGWT
jgi:two-component system, chemotaxis family, chemotaxis protein CheY